MEHVIVERVFSEPLTDAELEDMARRGRSCMDAHGVTKLRTYLSRDRKRTVCEYLAPDAEAVRRASELSGVPHERLWTADVFASDG